MPKPLSEYLADFYAGLESNWRDAAKWTVGLTIMLSSTSLASNLLPHFHDSNAEWVGKTVKAILGTAGGAGAIGILCLVFRFRRHMQACRSNKAILSEIQTISGMDKTEKAKFIAERKKHFDKATEEAHRVPKARTAKAQEIHNEH